MRCPKCNAELTSLSDDIYECPSCGIKIRPTSRPQEPDTLELDDKNFADEKFASYLIASIILFAIELILTIVLAFCELSLIGVIFITLLNIFASLAFSVCLAKTISFRCIQEYDIVQKNMLQKTYTKAIKKSTSKVAALEKRIAYLELLLNENRKPISDESPSTEKND